MNFKDIPEDLIEYFKDKRGGLFIGAGLSMDAGLPSWDGLLEDLINVADNLSHISKNRIQEYRDLKNDSTKFLFLAEDLKVELGKRFSQYFDEKFGNEDLKPTENHKIISKMDLSLILTINYDDLIERAFIETTGTYPNSFIYSDAKQAANNFWKNKFFILKAHGDAKKDVESLILSQRDYRRVLYREPGYKSLIQSIFTTRSMVFLGVSFSDPEFNQLLDYLHDSYHGGGPEHFLLMEESKMKESLERRYFEDFNINTITYKNDDGKHKEVTSFLKLLQNEIPRKGK